jgi:hypothetical protein
VVWAVGEVIYRLSALIWLSQAVSDVMHMIGTFEWPEEPSFITLDALATSLNITDGHLGR